MKKIINLMLIVSLLLTMGCSSKSQEATKKSEQAIEVEITEEPEAVETPIDDISELGEIEVDKDLLDVEITLPASMFKNENLKTISISFVVGLFSMLGFILTGLAFVSGSVSFKATKNIFKKDKIECLTRIFFSFYFIGMVIGVDILFFIIVLLAAFSSFGVTILASIILSFLIFYTTLFVIFYSIGLFETCINIFYINYKFNQKDDKGKNNN